MPLFFNSLIGVGKLCDAGFTVKFTKTVFIISNPNNKPIITGWREKNSPKLWRISLIPSDKSEMPNNEKQSSLVAFSAYYVPSVRALVLYLHAAAGFPG